MPTRRRMHRIGAHMTATAATAEYLAVGLTTRARRPSPSAGVGAEPERRPQTVVEHWAPRETAIIVCDMWDLHHCLNATRRGAELCPRMEQMLVTLRTAGVTVIHSPSGCMNFYADTPARRRAQDAPAAAGGLPEGIDEWQHTSQFEPPTTGTHEGEHGAEADGCVPGGYPIDQRASEEDDDPTEHAAWAKQLVAAGLRADAPWTRQAAALTIDQSRDIISDKGCEIWNVLTTRGISKILMAGVHTNMCVLGRPFGLRQLARLGKTVALVRDMTDAMYDPALPPFVTHFKGTSLICDYIEAHICPTTTSASFLGGAPFHFAGEEAAAAALAAAQASLVLHNGRLVDRHATVNTAAASAVPCGPLVFDSSGRLPPSVLAAYRAAGCYRFTGVINPAELGELCTAVEMLLELVPSAPGSETNKLGSAALFADHTDFMPSLGQDGETGDDQAPHEMQTYPPPPGMPTETLRVLSGWLRLAKEFPAFLRLYGHPKLLAIASSVCGEDFVPSGGGESIQLMEPFIGSASAWHQDGTSHFGSQWGELENEHGFNFMVQLYGSTPANAVYAVPASHHEGRSDIAALVSEHGERLETLGAVPLLSDPGDVLITDRSILHGSFPNQGPDRRVTIHHGFHRRAAVLSGAKPDYTPEKVLAKAKAIEVGIACRQAHLPEELPFLYTPTDGSSCMQWDPEDAAMMGPLVGTLRL